MNNNTQTNELFNNEMFECELRFYNSRTKQIDLFTHNKNIPINIYTCGPTVYDQVHLGIVIK